MAQPPNNDKPVSMKWKYHDQLCEMADREDLRPGEVRERESYPVFEFSGGHRFYENQDGTGTVRRRP